MTQGNQLSRLLGCGDPGNAGRLDHPALPCRTRAPQAFRKFAAQPHNGFGARCAIGGFLVAHIHHPRLAVRADV